MHMWRKDGKLVFILPVRIFNKVILITLLSLLFHSLGQVPPEGKGDNIGFINVSDNGVP